MNKAEGNVSAYRQCLLLCPALSSAISWEIESVFPLLSFPPCCIKYKGHNGIVSRRAMLFSTLDSDKTTAPAGSPRVTNDQTSKRATTRQDWNNPGTTHRNTSGMTQHHTTSCTQRSFRSTVKLSDDVVSQPQFLCVCVCVCVWRKQSGEAVQLVQWTL